MPSGRAGAWPKASAGSRLSSTTIRMRGRRRGLGTPRRDRRLLEESLPPNKTPEDEPSGVHLVPFHARVGLERTLRTQNMIRTAPTKAIAAHTASTFSRQDNTTFGLLGW